MPSIDMMKVSSFLLWQIYIAKFMLQRTRTLLEAETIGKIENTTRHSLALEFYT